MKLILSTLCLTYMVIGLVQGDDKVLATKMMGFRVPDSLNYGDFVERYHKSYSLTETINKARYFFGRTLSIFKHNILYKSKKVDHYLRQSEFLDMTPEEFNSTFRTSDLELGPIEGASKWPDLPADKLEKLVAKLKNGVEKENEDTDDDYSQSASLGAMLLPHDREPGGPNPRRRNPIVNFFAVEETVMDPDAALAELKSELKTTTTTTDGKQLRDKLMLGLESDGAPGQKLELAELNRQLRGVKYVPVVRPNNRDYDPSLLPSQSSQATLESFGENFAKIMMDDFTSNIAPYPTPSIPAHRVLTDEQTGGGGGGSTLSSLMQSIKSIYNFFDSSDDDDDDGDAGDLSEDEEDDRQIAATTSTTTSTTTRKPRAGVEDVSQDKGAIKYDIDWRQSGCIPRAKSQSKCNSCYAFATLDVMEFFYCRQKREYTEFSAQYVIDCGSKSKLNGCSGGKLTNVGLFIREHGIQLESLYPYRAEEQRCPFDDAEAAKRQAYPLKPVIKGWRMFSEMSAWSTWLRKSPIIVGINMPSDFLAYGGGVHDGSDCVPGMVHAMVLVGSGTRDGKPFWLLKNTFSSEWGEEGYFMLSKQAPLKCFNSAVVVRANFNVEA